MGADQHGRNTEWLESIAQQSQQKRNRRKDYSNYENQKISILSFALALALVVCVTTAFATSAAAKNNNSISVPSIIHRDDATNKTSESALGSEDGYQSLLALKSAGYLNQTVADFDKALLD